MNQKIFGLLFFVVFILNCSKPINTIVNQMEIPKNIDKDAKWRDNLWHKGTISKKGKPIGRYTIWSEDGELMHDAEFFKSGKILWLKSYYPDLTVGRNVLYDEKTNKTTVTYKSNDQQCSWLITPLPIADKGFAKKEYNGKLSFENKEIFNGHTDGVTFYSESGELLYTASSASYSQLVTKYSNKSKNERWEDALQRLKNYFEGLKQFLKREHYYAIPILVQTYL